MCGIAGLYCFNNHPDREKDLLQKALRELHARGPDHCGFVLTNNACLGHTRLAIIDTSTSANQPFRDATGRFTLVFNGELYNFKELREILKRKDYTFRTESDTEVLLHWLMEFGMDKLNDLQGFFAFAFHDSLTGTLWLVRDRVGVKPLYFFSDQDKLVFASEMKAMIAMGVPRHIDRNSLAAYLHLNYIPGPWSIFEGVQKLNPGHYLIINAHGANLTRYYSLPQQRFAPGQTYDYENACRHLRELLHQAVAKRLVADVSVGTFLSGGIDSSIITAVAAKQLEGLNTFSIGFRNALMHDESGYARLVAKKHKTQHNEIMITTHDLLDCLPDVLNYCDEPFADSSALAVFILSRETRKQVKVALSGDGADELFAGYYKHHAEWKVRQKGPALSMIGQLYPLLRHLPQSRSNYWMNKIRQIVRFSEGMVHSPDQRYWRWAGFTSSNQVEKLLAADFLVKDLQERKAFWLQRLTNPGSFEEMLLTDMQLVLPYDMMVKTDMMSMANSLEVREPYLDHLLVDFVMQLPVDYLIDNKRRKKILLDAFKDDLPQELHTRKKMGFEVPILSWLRGPLRNTLQQELLNPAFLEEQKIFNPSEIHSLVRTLLSGNPGDAPARVWGLLVFQYWYKKHML